jgi:hypothetical protein
MSQSIQQSWLELAKAVAKVPHQHSALEAVEFHDRHPMFANACRADVEAARSSVMTKAERDKAKDLNEKLEEDRARNADAQRAKRRQAALKRRKRGTAGNRR